MKKYIIIEQYLDGTTKEAATVFASSKEEALKNYKSDNTDWWYQFVK